MKKELIFNNIKISKTDVGYDVYKSYVSKKGETKWRWDAYLGTRLDRLVDHLGETIIHDNFPDLAKSLEEIKALKTHLTHRRIDDLV
jgi:hypothetical protein